MRRRRIEGTYYLTASGTADKPIVIKGAGDGEVIFDGNGNFNLFNVKAADYNYFEGVTIRNTDIAIWAGTQFIAGSKGLTVKNCRFENVGIGIFTNYSGSSNFYIADNYFIGRDDPEAPDRMERRTSGRNSTASTARSSRRRWRRTPPSSSTAPATSSPTTTSRISTTASTSRPTETRTARTRIDGPHYPPKEYWDRRPVAIDFYNNYMTNFHDNAFEIDGSMHNVRVMRNMMVNSASHPFCNQPAIGGPVYWIRNIAYHAPGGSTRMTNGAAGVLFYNNTILTETVGRIVGERALAQQSDAGRELRAGDLQRQHQHELHARTTTDSGPIRAPTFVPMELAAVDDAADYGPCCAVAEAPVRRRRARRLRDVGRRRHRAHSNGAVSRRWPSTRRRRIRISTASTWITTFSSMCRSSTRRTCAACRGSIKPRTGFPVEDRDRRRSIAASGCPTSPTDSRGRRRILVRSRPVSPAPHYGPR